MVFGGSPLNTLKLLSVKCFIILFNVHEQCIFYPFKILLKKLCWFSCVRRKFFLDENQNNRFSDMKELQKTSNILNYPPKKIHNWFSKTTIDLIRFMKIHQHTLMFSKKLLVPDWFCGRVIHLNLCKGKSVITGKTGHKLKFWIL